MTIKIGNAPCSWGVEFAEDPRNPSWETVLDECKAAGYHGIELGPVGFMPEDPAQLGEALAARDLELIGGVLFRPFHDPQQWEDVLDGAVRTCRALRAHGARHFVLIDSISPDRAPTAGRPDEAMRFDGDQWAAYVNRITQVAKMGYEEYGLTASIHPHAGGFCDFLPEVERLLDETNPEMLRLTLDTGHSHYAGFDPVPVMRKYIDRIDYVHFKDIDPGVKRQVIAGRTDFYEACAQGIFCNLGEGETDFHGVRDLLVESAFEGWCTVEQDCDPTGETSPIADATANRNFLKNIGFH